MRAGSIILIVDHVVKRLCSLFILSHRSHRTVLPRPIRMSCSLPVVWVAAPLFKRLDSLLLMGERHHHHSRRASEAWQSLSVWIWTQKFIFSSFIRGSEEPAGWFDFFLEFLRRSATNISPTTASSTWGQHRAGPALTLTLKWSPDQYQVSSAQLQTSGQVSKLIYLCVAFLYVVTLLTCYLVTLMFVALALKLTAHSLSLV